MRRFKNKIQQGYTEAEQRTDHVSWEPAGPGEGALFALLK